MLLMLVIYELPLLVLWWHGVKLGPGPQELGPWDSGTQDPPQNLKVRPREPFFLTAKFKKETQIMVFLHYFTCYTLYEKLRNFFKEIIFQEFSLCPYCPLNKVMCFRLISPGFFRKDFIIEDLLDIHEKTL